MTKNMGYEEQEYIAFDKSFRDQINNLTFKNEEERVKKLREIGQWCDDKFRYRTGIEITDFVKKHSSYSTFSEKVEALLKPKKAEKKTGLTRRESKLWKALEAGAKLVEISSSKIAWDIGHEKIKLRSGKMDYRVHQVLHCASDLIARGEWSELIDPERPKCFIVPITYKQFTDFIDDKNISTANVTGYFKKVPEVVLEGEVDIPYCLAERRWLRLRHT